MPLFGFFLALDWVLLVGLAAVPFHGDSSGLIPTAVIFGLVGVGMCWLFPRERWKPRTEVLVSFIFGGAGVLAASAAAFGGDPGYAVALWGFGVVAVVVASYNFYWWIKQTYFLYYRP